MMKVDFFRELRNQALRILKRWHLDHMCQIPFVLAADVHSADTIISFDYEFVTLVSSAAISYAIFLGFSHLNVLEYTKLKRVHLLKC